MFVTSKRVGHSYRYFQSLSLLTQFYCGNIVLQYLQRNAILSTSRKLQNALQFRVFFGLHSKSMTSLFLQVEIDAIIDNQKFH